MTRSGIRPQQSPLGLQGHRVAGDAQLAVQPEAVAERRRPAAKQRQADAGLNDVLAVEVALVAEGGGRHGRAWSAKRNPA